MKPLYLITVGAMALTLAASGPALAGKRRTTTTTTATAVSAYTSGAATLNHAGRLLASNCFQCHGTNGHGMESLAGKSASDISGDLYEMKQKPAGAEMMNVHAQGYSTDQINKIADYFSKQQR
jgi:cytochrome subunit of sulfide dehydrogenase